MLTVFLLPFARIAQLVEQLFSNQQVGGSDPYAGASYCPIDQLVDQGTVVP